MSSKPCAKTNREVLWPSFVAFFQHFFTLGTVMLGMRCVVRGDAVPETACQSIREWYRVACEADPS